MLFVFARVNCIQLTGDRMNRLLIRSQCSLREFASLDINQIKTIRQRKQNENKKNEPNQRIWQIKIESERKTTTSKCLSLYCSFSFLLFSLWVPRWICDSRSSYRWTRIRRWSISENVEREIRNVFLSRISGSSHVCVCVKCEVMHVFVCEELITNAVCIVSSMDLHNWKSMLQLILSTHVYFIIYYCFVFDQNDKLISNFMKIVLFDFVWMNSKWVYI